MELLSPGLCRPLDARRDGLVLGEAVAAIRLSATPSRWKIAGLASGLDGYSTTGPDPEGGPIARVMADCLRDAQLTAGDIELIKAAGGRLARHRSCRSQGPAPGIRCGPPRCSR